jgi:hypothetical protein
VSDSGGQLDALARSRYISLATFRRNGNVVATPVWFAPAGDGWYVFTAARSGKVKRLRHTPNVRVSACDMRGKVSGPVFDTDATLTTDNEEIEGAYAALMRRYGWQLKLTNLLSWLGRRLDKRQMIRITPPREQVD